MHTTINKKATVTRGPSAQIENRGTFARISHLNTHFMIKHTESSHTQSPTRLPHRQAAYILEGGNALFWFVITQNNCSLKRHVFSPFSKRGSDGAGTRVDHDDVVMLRLLCDVEVVMLRLRLLC